MRFRFPTRKWLVDLADGGLLAPRLHHPAGGVARLEGSRGIMEVGQAANRLQPAGLVNGVGDKMSSSMFQDLATLLANSMWYPQAVTISWTKIPMEGNALGKFHVVSADTRSSSPQAHPLTA